MTGRYAHPGVNQGDGDDGDIDGGDSDGDNDNSDGADFGGNTRGDSASGCDGGNDGSDIASSGDGDVSDVNEYLGARDTRRQDLRAMRARGHEHHLRGDKQPQNVDIVSPPRYQSVLSPPPIF